MKIMLVEDNEAIIMGVEYLLSQEGYQVLTARRASEAEELLGREGCDLILLDISLPDGDGFQICRKVKQGTDIPIIFLTAREEESDVVKGLDMGADDYVIKPFRNRELVSRIKRVLCRNGKGSTVLHCQDVSLDTVTGRVSKGGCEVALTKLEYRILSSLMAHPGKLFSREELLTEIWDMSGNFVNDNTLSVTVKRIREKLGDGDGHFIRTVRGMGYRVERENGKA